MARGRPKGALGLRTQSLISILEAHNYSPVAEIIKNSKLAKIEFQRCEKVVEALLAERRLRGMPSIAIHSEALGYLKIMQDCAKDLMPYTYPKLAAIEVTPQGSENIFKSFVDMVKQIADADANKKHE